MGVSGAQMSVPFLRIQSSGIGVWGLTGSAQPPPDGAASGSSQKAWPLHLLPLCPRRILESVIPTYKGPAVGAALGSWQGCRDLPTGAHTAGVPVTWALTGVPCFPPVPGGRRHGSLTPTSHRKAGAGVPENLQGRQPGVPAPGLHGGGPVPSSVRP